MGKITFILQDQESVTVAADPGNTVMQIATSQAIPGIDAECGGALSCATCHVYLREEWLRRIPQATTSEQQMLEFVDSPRQTSRLACQIRFTEDIDGLCVEVPEQQ